MATKNTRNEMTGSRAASAAGKVLQNPHSSAAAKSAAASTLTQRASQIETTQARAASRASEVLRNPQSTAAEKSAAASALTQVKKK